MNYKLISSKEFGCNGKIKISIQQVVEILWQSTPHKFKSLAMVITSLILFIGGAAHAQNTTYQWVSSDGDPYGIKGTIVLNSPSGQGFADSDIISITFSDIYITNNGISLNGFEDVNITWDSNSITSGSITAWYDEADNNSYFSSGITPGGQTNITTLIPGVEDPSGAWLILGSSASASPPALSIQSNGDGTETIMVTGQTNQVYTLQSTGDLLATWQDIANLTNITGTVTYLNTNTPSIQQQFYRARVN